MNQDTLLYIVLALFGGGTALGIEPVRNKLTELYTLITSLFKSKKDSNKLLVEVDEDDLTYDPLPSFSVHELLEELLKRSEEEQDSEGLMLLGAFGKHVYDRRLEPKTTPVKKAAKKGNG